MAPSLGKQLRKIRESREISLEEISQKTRIRLAYLIAIEIDDLEVLPSQTHLKGFLRLYASELGISLDDLNQLEEDRKSQEGDQTEEIIPSDNADSPRPQKLETSASEINPETPLQHEAPQESIAVEPEFQTEPVIEKQATETSSNASENFKQIGKKMRAQRELLSLSLDDIQDNTHIRKDFLKAIEAGDFDQLPSPVQAKGMITNYADFISLDVDPLLLNYADGLQELRLKRQSTITQKKRRPAKEISSTRLKLKNFFSLDLLVVTLLFLGFAAFVIWGVDRIIRGDSPDAAAIDIPEVSDILLATGSPTPQISKTPDPVIETGINDETSEDELPLLFTPVSDNFPINILIIPQRRVWVRVITDADVAFEGRLLPGNAYDFAGQESIEILTGNAGVLQIFFNDQDIGSAGLVGQVVNMIFTENGLVRPAATNTPTITATPEITPTSSNTPTEIND